ncbi:MAG: MFS transporter, partial [Lachnospiraceae bacterium]|nr:MFS transporter [Lachnospiraceae bacterium]
GLVLVIPSLIAVTMSRNVLLCTALLIPTSMFLNFAFSPSVALGQKFIPNHLGLASGITMGLASSFGGVISPMLGKVADNMGIPVVMWILVGIAAAACLSSFFVPDAPENVEA